MKNKHQNILYPASAVCFCMLLLGIIFPYSPAPDTAEAATIDPTNFGLTLDLNNNIDINLNPSIAGQLQVNTQQIGIKAGSPNGYQLLFSVDGSDNNIYLDGEQPTGTADSTKTIYAASSANSNLALDNTHFARWGYSTGSNTTSFSPLPTASNEVQLNAKATATSGFEYTTVNYGIKANLGLSSGAYTTKINYIAISNVADVLSAAEITGTKEFSPDNVAAGSATTIVATGLSMTGKALTPSDLTVQIGTTTVPAADITITQQLPNLILNVKLPTTLAVGNYAVTITLNNSHVAGNFKSYTIAENDGIVVKPSVLYMQDVATWKSQLANTGDSMQVVDKRDDKMYWVTKLADGNIWMTQNLDLDLNADTLPLTSTLSDVSTDWNPGSTYYTKTTTSSSSTDTDKYSWNLGDYYWNPQGNTSWTSCGTSATSYDNCTGYGFQKTKPSKDIAGNDLNSDMAEHYHVGNLYQWSTATAGTGDGLRSGADATSSICPSGWRLPYSGDTTSKYAFGTMLTAYNYSSWSDKKDIAKAPLFFVPAGYVGSGTLGGAGISGRYWSSRANSGPGAYVYGLNFLSTNVYPSNTLIRYGGYSVRCVAR